MKLIFMGTPDFAKGALSAILDAGHEVVCVVTQPDKPKGRSSTLVPSPVKELALKKNIEVFQPARIKTPQAIAYLKSFEADIFVVAAFGQILSKEILEMPKYGCVNIHASLLPGYRGASPIQRVILDGEKQTGITIMKMDEGLDTGDILLQKSMPIWDTDTVESLHDKLMELGKECITEALLLIQKNQFTPIK